MATEPGETERRSCAALLVDCLKWQGVRRVYGVPGESFISVLDAIERSNDLDYIVTRHEGGAAMMADAEAKLTGRPGVLFLARGPGAANAMSGLHVAAQDSTPMVAFVGLVPDAHDGREGFQEIDVPRFFGGVAKWAATVHDPSRLQEILMRAFGTATSGRPGPVAIGMPEDVLQMAVDALPLPESPPEVPVSGPTPAQIERVIAALNAAERPLAIVGGSLWSEEARAAMEGILRRARIPVAAAFRCQDYVDNELPGHAGHLGLGMDPALARLLPESDLLFVIGTRIDDPTTRAYTLIDIPFPKQTLVHVHPSGEALHRFVRADLPIACDPRAFVAALAAAADRLEVPAGRAEWQAKACTVGRAWREPAPMPGDVQLGEIVAWLRAHLPEDAVIANGAGNYAGWVHRHFTFRKFRTQLAPTAGCMGYGLPAAIAAGLVDRNRPAIAVAGDGCIQMTIQELATAADHGLPVIAIVIDNASLGAIRMHQERAFPGRVYATDLRNPDFEAIARAYGLFAARVDRTADFAPAFEAALASGGPALLHLRVPIEALSAGATLTQIRAAGGGQRH